MGRNPVPHAGTGFFDSHPTRLQARIHDTTETETETSFMKPKQIEIYGDRVRERFPIMVNTIDGTSSSLSEILASGSSRFPARGR
jgi:hypothetical protein